MIRTPSTTSRWLALVVAAITLGLVAPVPGLAQEDDDTPVVRMARASWDTGWFQTEIYRILLNRIGYEVDGPTTMENEEFYSAVVDGSVDLWVNGWFPLHAAFLEEEDRAEPVGVQVDAGALQGYFVDLTTATEFEITNLGDLADPAIAELFDVDGNGRADLIGCNLEWACAEIVDHHLDEYGLTDTVDHIQADYSPLMEETVERHARGEPVLYYTFTPNWTVGQLVPGEDVRWLETPYPALPDGSPTDLARTELEGLAGCVNDPCQTGWPPNDIRAVANVEFLDDNPAVRRLLEAVTIPLDDIHDQNARMVDGEGDSQDIRRHAEEWVEANAGLVSQWVDAADSDAEPVDGGGSTTVGSGGTLRIAVRTLEPFVRYEGRTYSGFSVELMDLIAARLGMSTDVYGVNTVAKQIDDVERGAADVAVGALGIISNREAVVDFSLPVLDTGLTILVPTDADRPVVERLGALVGAIFSSELPWMILGFLLVLLLSAHLMWWFERRDNPDFPLLYRRGIWDAFYWAVVTITTVGYGDKTPKGNAGRTWTLLWMIAGYFVFASFTATITSTLAIDQLRGSIEGPSDLPRHRVATVGGSEADTYLSSQGIGPVRVDSIEDAYELLDAEEVDAVVFDAPVLRYFAAHDGSGAVHTVGPVFEDVRYGIAVGDDADDLREQINLALLDLLESGVYQQLHDKWFGSLSG